MKVKGLKMVYIPHWLVSSRLWALELNKLGLPVDCIIYQLCDLLRFSPSKLLPASSYFCVLGLDRSPILTDIIFLTFKMIDLNQIGHL
jgi:hypothetical protein